MINIVNHSIKSNEFLTLLLVMLSVVVFAQNDSISRSPLNDKEKREPKFTAAVDVVYPYLWRGLRYNGDMVAFQSSLNYAFSD